MNVHFYTRLDALRPFVQKLPAEWYNFFRSFPNKGHLIQIPTDHQFSFELEVVSVVWAIENGMPVVRIQLGIPSHYPSHNLEYWNALYRQKLEEHKEQSNGLDPQLDGR